MTIEQLLSWFVTNLATDISLKIVQIASVTLVAITVIFTIKSYLKMRRTEQIKIAHEFFKDYSSLEKESETLRQQGKGKEDPERADWASRYLNTIEWFSFLVNSKQIKDSKLIGFYSDIIDATHDEILPFYHTQEQIEKDDLYPELRKLYKRMHRRWFNLIGKQSQIQSQTKA